MKYIPLDALAAELERRIKKSRDNANIARLNNNHSVTCVWAGHEKECHELKSFIDTFEMKEVDLEKELIEWHKEHFKKDGTFIGKSGFYLTNNSQMDIAKHFFELGLKAQKGE